MSTALRTPLTVAQNAERHLLPPKLCGRRQSCFVVGPEWGHMEGILCHHLCEDDYGVYCEKDSLFVQEDE
jgi:hypothetical protein